MRSMILSFILIATPVMALNVNHQTEQRPQKKVSPQEAKARDQKMKMLAKLAKAQRPDTNGLPIAPLGNVVHVMGSQKSMPQFGFGTCFRDGAKGPKLIESTKAYLRMGGRHIDTAHMCENHKDLAIALRESHVPRDELWVTSKVWVDTNRGPHKKKALNLIAKTATGAEAYVDKALNELGLNYLDLMLLQWPSKNSSTDVELWDGLIRAKNAGKVMNIGVSNYDQAQIENLYNKTGVMPAVNQIFYAPGMDKKMKNLVQWCQRKGIVVTAWGSIRGGNKANQEVLQELQQKYKKSSEQILQRWAVDQGVVVIPGATSAEHIKENLDLGKNDFKLKEEVIEALDKESKFPTTTPSL